jgi:uncharacterized protein YgiM (DUF1202 family)
MKKSKNKLIVGGIALVLTGLGLYFILRKKSNKGSGSGGNNSGGGTSGGGTSGGIGNFQKYRVATSSSNLNVRSSPSTSSTSISSLPKNSIIWARESGTSGWMEYSSDGVNGSGYVSKMYLSSDLTGGGSSSGSGSSSGASSSYFKYLVTTSTSNLNVRSAPNSTASIVTSLPKGSEIWAKPSGTSGWLEYSSDGVNRTGYVSETYLTLS